MEPSSCGSTDPIPEISSPSSKPLREDGAIAIFEFGSSVDGAEGKLGPAVIADLEMSRFDEIEVIVITQIGLDKSATGQ